jgi:metacaspase-1
MALGWGSSGPAVEQLQQRLKALGYFSGVVDGRYGALTYSAVKRFQEANGLTADGIAGPDTLAALEGAPSTGTGGGSTGGTTGTSQAMACCIGINRVDSTQYGGWDGALSGCEKDAQTMAAIATAEGFTTKQLYAPQATSTNILNEIRWAAQTLAPGGTFLLTYAGHGGQNPDPTGQEETDQQDETWVAYNRQILDDELEQAFTEFQAGVNIIVISDSCHSGTVSRLGPPQNNGSTGQGEVERELQRQFAELKSSFYRNLAIPRPGPGDPPFAGFPRPQDALLTRERGQVVRLEPAMAGVRAQAMVDDAGRPAPIYAPPPRYGYRSTGGASEEGTYATRNIPLAYNDIANEIQSATLARAKTQARSRGAVRARGLLLSGCKDNQLSQEVGGAGVFTTAVNRVWAGNGFAGNYEDFMRQVVSQMGPTQTPQLSTFGDNPQLLAARTPFNVS